MSLVNLTSFSGITDGANASPSYLNSKFSQLESMITAVNSAGTDFGAVTSGSTTTFPVGQRFVLQSVDSGGWGINVLAYGADPTGASSSVSAFVSAISAANSRVHQILVPAGTYLIDSTISVGPSVNGLKIKGAGRFASKLSATHNGDIFTLNTGAGFGFESLQIHTGGGPASGNSRTVGVHVIGNTNEFNFRDCEIISMATFGILFEAGTGSGALISDCVFSPNPSSVTTMSSGQSNVPAIGQRGDDISACPRYIVNCLGIGGADLWNLDTPNDMSAENCFFRNAVVTGSSGGNILNVQYYGTRLATVGYPTYLRGGNPTFIGGAHAGNIIIDAGAANAYVATSCVSGIVDNSTSTNMVVGGAYNFGNGFVVAASALSIGNLTAGGTAIRGISSTSSLVAAFAVQGSASSSTVITWAAAQPGDQILVTIRPDAAASSLSGGLVAHSHCTVAGRVELRLSNVSTLVQNQSSKTYYLTRITPF